MNNITVIGYLGRDAEVKKVQTGKEIRTVLDFTLADDQSYKNAQGVKNNQTNWFDCERWGMDEKAANNLAASLKKGSHIAAVGEFAREDWSKDGKSGTRLRLKVRNVQFLDKKAAQSGDNALVDGDTGEVLTEPA